MRAFLLLWLWLTVVSPVLSDADFLSVRTAERDDHSGKAHAAPEKYFHESTFHYHYDGRFSHKTIPDDERIPYLTAMAKSYLSLMSDIGAETWIMHGTLMGWWWNEKILPWDSDLDVQVSKSTMHFLANYYNMTEHHFDIPGSEPHGRKYLLEINPQFVVRSFSDWMNVIDARWIDTSSGLFVDITCVAKNDDDDSGDEDLIMSKDKHKYKKQDIFPLRNSHFEGMPVKVPFNYKKLLQEEYGKDSIIKTYFNNHKFNEDTNLWEFVPPEERPSPPPPKEQTNAQLHS